MRVTHTRIQQPYNFHMRFYAVLQNHSITELGGDPYGLLPKGGKTMRNSKTNELVLTGLFTAIIIIMAFTPLGYIPLVVINATIIHIPVILSLIHI